MDREIKFGLKHFSSPTPAHINRRIAVWTVVLTTIGGAINTAPFITATLASTVSWFVFVSIGILQGIRPLYAVETDEKRVPVEDVASIETKKNEN